MSLEDVFEENHGGVDNKRAFLHAKMWDIYVNENKKLIKGGYLVEVVGSDRKKVFGEVINDYFV